MWGGLCVPCRLPVKLAAGAAKHIWEWLEAAQDIDSIEKGGHCIVDVLLMQHYLCLAWY